MLEKVRDICPAMKIKNLLLYVLPSLMVIKKEKKNLYCFLHVANYLTRDRELHFPNGDFERMKVIYLMLINQGDLNIDGFMC